MAWYKTGLEGWKAVNFSFFLVTQNENWAASISDKLYPMLGSVVYLKAMLSSDPDFCRLNLRGVFNVNSQDFWAAAVGEKEGDIYLLSRQMIWKLERTLWACKNQACMTKPYILPMLSSLPHLLKCSKRSQNECDLCDFGLLNAKYLPKILGRNPFDTDSLI